MEQLEDKSTATARYRMTGMVFLGAVLLGLAYASWLLNDWLEDSQKAPIGLPNHKKGMIKKMF